MDGKILRVPESLLGRGMNRILVLDDYPNLVTKICNDMQKGSPGCMIIGTPGIGKSTFLPYLLLQMLSQGLSAVYFYEQCHIFTSDGVYTSIGNGTSVFLDPLFNGIPALVDVDNPNAVNTFSDAKVKVYTVLVSSPKDGIINKYQKQRHAATFIPKSPSHHEAFIVWNLRFGEEDVKLLEAELKAAWRHYGPDFRLGNSMISDHQTLEEHHDEVRKDITELEWKDIRSPSHNYIETYFLPSRPNVPIHRLRSRTILRMFIAAITVHELRERREMYRLFHSTGRLSASRGYLFEVMADEILSQGYDAILQPEDGSTTIPFTLRPHQIELFSNMNKANTTTNRSKFYVPLQGNNPTYDAFCYQDGIGIAFQDTICFKHKFSLKGFRDLNARFNAAGVTQKYFIFVIPIGNVFKYPVLPVFRAGWQFFVLELDAAQLDAQAAKHLSSESGMPDRDEEQSDEEDDDSDYNMGD
ncbi:hypothetical protein GYMLUDRAFT_99509 [Collybiopsis luxurians FD-317 M1]|uniref:Unplaced genomic scaffold GYMLUscaffold_57, whole genome shotgun sequence n=1 Tax=Collybiopsis luxurians FD-317 M1 TaxID=944289 RepID=A0A0D0CKE4_9AGAR|nr:hypothetical protein GYMLUDRAFT_99509 [Collybiopsis luxurians FD-317 M1]